MTAAARTVLEWTYEPSNFFEEQTRIAYEEGGIEIGAGIARGTFGPERYEQGELFRNKMHKILNSYFLSQQIFSRQPYTLEKPNLVLEHADGRRAISLTLESVVLVTSFGSLDITATDADGNIIADSKADRLERQAQFREQVATILPHDAALRRMLQSFRNAMDDQDNLLVYLFEIRDALVGEFSDAATVRAAVKVSNADWRKFGQLANDEPLQEGRHRGKHATLRSASADESAWAIEFGRRLIEGYVQARHAGWAE
jgi:hypothetical protein